MDDKPLIRPYFWVEPYKRNIGWLAIVTVIVVGNIRIGRLLSSLEPFMNGPFASKHNEYSLNSLTCIDQATLGKLFLLFLVATYHPIKGSWYLFLQDDDWENPPKNFRSRSPQTKKIKNTPPSSWHLKISSRSSVANLPSTAPSCTQKPRCRKAAAAVGGTSDHMAGGGGVNRRSKVTCRYRPIVALQFSELYGLCHLFKYRFVHYRPNI